MGWVHNILDYLLPELDRYTVDLEYLRELLREIQDQIKEHDLAGRVQATPCRCIFGCTYGPRIDVINRATGEKILYGSVEAQVYISVRGRVDMNQIPNGLIGLALDNLT